MSGEETLSGARFQGEGEAVQGVPPDFPRGPARGVSSPFLSEEPLGPSWQMEHMGARTACAKGLLTWGLAEKHGPTTACEGRALSRLCEQVDTSGVHDTPLPRAALGPTCHGLQDLCQAAVTGTWPDLPQPGRGWWPALCQGPTLKSQA